MYTEEGEKKDNAYLFEDKKIMQAGERYLAHMGQYPVINLTFKDAKPPDFELAYDAMCRQIANEYLRHKFILSDEKLSEEKEEYLSIMRRKADRGSYNQSIAFLSRCLEKYYGRKAIILLDEYDVPLENAFTENFYETISSFDESENYYHGLVAGLLSGMKGYRTVSNRETGKGRCDLFVKPVSRRKEAFIVEFKTTKKMKEIEKRAEEALEQIAEKRYFLELEEDGYDQYCSYGIAFCGKDCCVRVR